MTAWKRLEYHCSVIDDGTDQWCSGADVSMPAFEPKEDNLNIHCDTN